MKKNKEVELPVCCMIKEIKNDFESIISIVEHDTAHFIDVDKRIFKVYDFISRVIPTHRSVTLDENFHVVPCEHYLALLDDFEYVYSKIKELL